MLALIGVDEVRVAELLTMAQGLLAPELDWLVVHVADTRPLEEAERALGGLIGREPARHRAEHQLEDTIAWDGTAVREAIRAWLAAAGREGQVVLTRGRPEREIIRLAGERAVDLIVLGRGRDPDRHHPGPGDFSLSPLARFVTDHARCSVLLLHDRQ